MIKFFRELMEIIKDWFSTLVEVFTPQRYDIAPPLTELNILSAKICSSMSKGSESLPSVEGLIFLEIDSTKKSEEYFSIVFTSNIIFDSDIKAFIES